MDAHAVFEVRNIVIAFLPRIVRYVQADSPIQADNEEGQVVARSPIPVPKARSFRKRPHFNCPPGRLLS